jgi:hypothetical protein
MVAVLEMNGLPPNHCHQRIAARVRFGKNLKGLGWAARAEAERSSLHTIFHKPTALAILRVCTARSISM